MKFWVQFTTVIGLLALAAGYVFFLAIVGSFYAIAFGLWLFLGLFVFAPVLIWAAVAVSLLRFFAYLDKPARTQR